MQIILLYIAISAYALFTVFVITGWWRAVFSSSVPEKTSSKASIIIPFRNESERLMPLILSIKIILDKNKNCEFIFVDDHSEDSSISILQKEFLEFQDVKIIQLPAELSGKKSAITFGIKHATHEHIITTDADCELSEQAINSMLYHIEKPSVQMVCGIVHQYSGKGFGARLVDLEFLSLIGSGISFWGNGMAFMANGAFLGFKKIAFETVNGFVGTEQFPGGDDVFLLQKIASHYGKKSIQFLTASDDSILTKGDQSFSEFIERRIRWGAKAKAYQSVSAKLFSVYIFSINVFYLITLLFLTIHINGSLFLCAITLKLFCDILMLVPMIIRFKKWGLLAYIPITSLIHPFYIVFTGFLSLAGRYTWKKRNYR